MGSLALEEDGCKTLNKHARAGSAAGPFFARAALHTGVVPA